MKFTQIDGHQHYLKSETGGFLIAAQDQCLRTNYFRNQILTDDINSMCKIRNKQ